MCFFVKSRNLYNSIFVIILFIMKILQHIITILQFNLYTQFRFLVNASKNSFGFIYSFLFVTIHQNFVGYPYGVNKDINTPISDKVEFVKNFDGFFQPGGSVNSITNFIPGKGYFIKVNTDCNLIWE